MERISWLLNQYLVFVFCIEWVEYCALPMSRMRYRLNEWLLCASIEGHDGCLSKCFTVQDNVTRRNTCRYRLTTYWFSSISCAKKPNQILLRFLSLPTTRSPRSLLHPSVIESSDASYMLLRLNIHVLNFVGEFFTNDLCFGWVFFRLLFMLLAPIGWYSRECANCFAIIFLCFKWFHSQFKLM